MKKSTVIILLLIGLIGLLAHAADLGLSIYLLDQGLIEEANPIADYIYWSFGALGLVIYKISCVVVLYGIMYSLYWLGEVGWCFLLALLNMFIYFGAVSSLLSVLLTSP